MSSSPNHSEGTCSTTPNSPLQLEQITPYNREIFLNLAQAYEAEFSSITKKNPDSTGKYPLDTLPEDTVHNFLFFCGATPIGFALIGKENNRWDMAEFFVIPTFRRGGIGSKLAHTLFTMHQGPWQIRQIQGADHARAFWRAAISSFGLGNYDEVEILDEYWGPVTCQTFESSPR
jgi:predicted acetyltransferase